MSNVYVSIAWIVIISFVFRFLLTSAFHMLLLHDFSLFAIRFHAFSRRRCHRCVLRFSGVDAVVILVVVVVADIFYPLLSPHPLLLYICVFVCAFFTYDQGMLCCACAIRMWIK